MVIPKPVAKAIRLQHQTKVYWELKVENGIVVAFIKKLSLPFF